MNDSYIELTFSNLLPEQIELLIAKLSDNDFYGFEEEESILKAYIDETLFSEEKLKVLLAPSVFKYSITKIPATNWNETWEKNFEPVIVDDFVAVRADFHQPIK